ncbi:MAG TPA: F0F1 ATP synthase subunit delta [Gammaproteobacteria bacterium]|nr:F0F1 ATP synthase subunit delta [Gammaproteobacteria bacterium]
MAELSTLARPYADALFHIAQEGKRLSEWSELLREMAQIAAHPEMVAVAGDPNVSADRLYAVFAGAMQQSLPQEAQNFVRLLITNDRLTLLPAIAHAFEEFKNAHEGAAEAEIVTAFPLSDAQLGELVAAMEKKFGVRLKPGVKVDASLIGGVRVTVGDRTLDSSVSSQLERMRAALVA